MTDKRIFNKLNVAQVAEIAGNISEDEARELKAITRSRGIGHMQVWLVKSQNWWPSDIQSARENWARKIKTAERVRLERERKSLGLGGYARKKARSGYIIPCIEIDAYQKFLLDNLKGHGSVAQLVRRMLMAEGEARGLREQWDEVVNSSQE